MNKERKKLIIKAYKSLDNLDIVLDKPFYFLLSDYAKEYFSYEIEEGKIAYEAFFHKLYFDEALMFYYKGKKQGFYKNYFFSPYKAYMILN